MENPTAATKKNQIVELEAARRDRIFELSRPRCAPAPFCADRGAQTFELQRPCSKLQKLSNFKITEAFTLSNLGVRTTSLGTPFNLTLRLKAEKLVRSNLTLPLCQLDFGRTPKLYLLGKRGRSL